MTDEPDIKDEIVWSILQIRAIANIYQGKKLPQRAVGLIEKWCDNLEIENKKRQTID